MIKYITKEDYINLMGTEIVPDNFDNLIIEASSYIKRQTEGRIDENEVLEEVKYATCLIINKLYEVKKQKDEIGNLKSANIEGWSETYKTDEEIDSELEKDKVEILNTYLADLVGIDGNFLLYRGV